MPGTVLILGIHSQRRTAISTLLGHMGGGAIENNEKNYIIDKVINAVVKP